MYKKRMFGMFILCALFVSAFQITVSFATELVYDNTSTSFGYSPANVEYGDQITLGGTNRLMDNFTFAYQISLSSVIDGDETARIRFYANDAPGGFPGKLLYESNTFALTPSAGYNFYTLSHLSVSVPDTLTWTVLFGGIAFNEAANAGGLLFYNPPTIGTSDPGFFWAKVDNAFSQRTVINPPSPDFGNNFNAQITANPVPEPTTMLLLGLGLVGLAGVRRMLKK